MGRVKVRLIKFELTSQICASNGQYERGLVEGILPSATHSYNRRHVFVDDVCELAVGQKGNEQVISKLSKMVVGWWSIYFVILSS